MPSRITAWNNAWPSSRATEAALVFASGFAANTGAVAALAAVGDVVFTDRKNHASLIDGCRLSRADVRTYPHADWQTLESLLSKTSTDRDLHGAGGV